MTKFMKYVDFLMYYSGLKWYKGNRIFIWVIQRIHGVIFIIFYVGVLAILILDTPASLKYGGIADMDHFTIIVMNYICLNKIRTLYTPAMRSIVDYMNRREDQILKHGNRHVRRIYNASVRYGRKVCLMFIMNCFVMVLCYYVNTTLDLVRSRGKLAESVDEWPIMIKIWSVKLNKWMYYLITVAYWISAEAACVAFATTDCFILSVIIFFIGELKTLQHLISERRETDEELEYKDLCKYVRYHQAIIIFVERLDNSIKLIMFLEFLLRSAQLAVLVLQLLEMGLTYTMTFPLNFFIVNYVQLFLYYWHANELTLNSVAVSEALYNRKWFNSSHKANNLIMLMMMRAQKPLCLHIGPFGVMSTDILMNINKSIFSWISLMRRLIK